MRLTRLKVVLMAASICATALFASAGSAAANAGPRCGFGSSSNNVQTCITLLGSGVIVGEVHATAQVFSSTRDLQVCITRAGLTPLCSSVKTIKPGWVLPMEWNPNSSANTGDYCAQTTRVDSDGSKHQIGNECVSVS